MSYLPSRENLFRTCTSTNHMHCECRKFTFLFSFTRLFVTEPHCINDKVFSSTAVDPHLKGQFSIKSKLISIPRLALTAMVLSVFHAILAIIVLLLQMVLNLVLMALTPMKQEQLAAKHVMLDIPA